jgi:hypothetical protein
MTHAHERHRVDEDIDPDVRTAAIERVLGDVYPDRRDAEVVDAVPLDGRYVIGVKAAPNGYVSTAKYGLVTVDENGRVLNVEDCSGKTLRRELDRQDTE